jgi:hypothetical protein
MSRPAFEKTLCLVRSPYITTFPESLTDWLSLSGIKLSKFPPNLFKQKTAFHAAFTTLQKSVI